MYFHQLIQLFIYLESQTITPSTLTVNTISTLNFNKINIPKGTLKTGDCIAFQIFNNHWPGEYDPFANIGTVSVRFFCMY